jgi:hypothetical protein
MAAKMKRELKHPRHKQSHKVLGAMRQQRNVLLLARLKRVVVGRISSSQLLGQRHQLPE